MIRLPTTLFAAGLAMAAAAPAQAGDAYPEACRGDAHAMPMPADQMAMGLTEPHQQAAMPAMMRMNRDMMQGMSKKDADIAFICGMIAHHQGAIDMAKVELQYGDDSWARDMARKVIDAQTAEIAQMTEWLKANAQ